MSFFPGSFHSQPQASFTPLFRLLEDFENYSAPSRSTRAEIKHFQPKFDVSEHDEVYELHGDLPGIEQKDVEIEFTDRQTLTVRGRTERTHTSGTPPAGLEAPKATGAITEGEGEAKGHKATVEDSPEDAEKPAAETANTESQVTKQENTNTEVEKPAEPKAKYWISERSVGQFSRSFSFPEPVDHDNVKASMKNGVLTVVVPKAKKHETRKITISS
ncbi:putative heat shock protein 30 [Coleophoma cylindrospora]|uniref:Putative heat shock protein 30 n=1 Tax=Coleophoma cylindrospora TaxID=1849047 RepID=A0A3D8RTB6_9HELO|nr:putative heat shock protein 30 [Coleophoma cylindrospora]